jgi:hypothetical protein
VTGELVETLRKLHLATNPEGRPALMANLLLNDTPEVRKLGFELVGRELSVSGRIDGPVGAASITLLGHADPKVRSSAAVIVRQLAPEGAETAVAAALERETDPAAASDLLLAAARWPSSAIVGPVIRWIGYGDGPSDAAMEAAWFLFRAGELQGESAGIVLSTARNTAAERLNAAAISLLAVLGTDEDRARLVPLLQSSSGSVRQATGEALLWYPAFTGALMDAASADPDLFDIACRAVLVGEPDEASVRRLLDLPRPSAEVAVPSLLRTANGLSGQELLDISRSVNDTSLRRGLLTLLVSPLRVMSERADLVMLRAISEGVLDLTELELSERQPEAALAVLDNADFSDGVLDADRIAAPRCTALVALGHIDLAVATQAPCAAWLRGLEMAKNSEAAGRIVEAMEGRFASSMSGQEAAMFAVLKKEIAAAAAARQAEPRAGG